MFHKFYILMFYLVRVAIVLFLMNTSGFSQPITITNFQVAGGISAHRNNNIVPIGTSEERLLLFSSPVFGQSDLITIKTSDASLLEAFLIKNEILGNIRSVVKDDLGNVFYLINTLTDSSLTSLKFNIIKEDSIGEIKWAKELDMLGMPINQKIIGHSMHEYKGKLILTAFSSDGKFYHFIVDGSGVLIKNSVFNFDNYYSLSVILTYLDKNGYLYLLVKNQDTIDSEEKTGIFCFNSDGIFQWARNYHSLNGLSLRHIIVENQSIFAFGNVYSSSGFGAIVVCLDRNGKNKWSKMLKNNAVDSWIESGDLNSDSNLVFALNIFKESGVNSTTSNFIEIDQEGSILTMAKFQPFEIHSIVVKNIKRSQGRNLFFLANTLISSNNTQFVTYFEANLQDMLENKCCFDTSQMEFISVDIYDTLENVFYVQPLNITLKDASCQKVRTEIETKILCHEIPASSAITTTSDSSCIGECLALSLANPTPAVQYTWEYQQNGQNESRTDSLLLLCTPFPTNLRLKADRNGCINERSIEIPIETVDNIAFPSAFTPDGDNINDVFKPIAKTDCPFVDYHFQVFNRWGKRVFESTTLAEGWDGRMSDGRLAPAEVYIWTADFQAEIFGEMVHLQKKGDVTLIR